MDKTITRCVALVCVLWLMTPSCKSERRASTAGNTDSSDPAAERSTLATPATPATPVTTVSQPPEPPEPGDTPDAITEASPAYQPGPSVVATDSVDGAGLRARIDKRLRADRSPVTVLQGQDAKQLGNALCEAVVPRMPADVPVLLKPNIGGFAWFRDTRRYPGDNGVRGRTTDPEFVRGVIQCLRARGHQTITIAESWSAEPKDWRRLMEVSGYGELAKSENVALVALSDDGVFDVQGAQPGKPLSVSGMQQTSVPTLLMPKLLAEHLDHGLVISLPKIKTHRFSVVSLAIKGLQGTVMYSDKSPAYRQKWRSHRELTPYMKALKDHKQPEARAAYVRALEIFAERMVDVLAVEAPHVVLAEGVPTMSGDGFNELYPGAESVAIGGTNAVLVDAVGARFLGLFDNRELARELGGHQTSPLIELAAERFGLDLHDIDIKGDGAGLLDAVRPVHFVAMAPFQIISEARAPGPPGGNVDVGTPGTDSAADRDERGKPIVRARFAGGATITLDGKADEAAWRAAKAVSWDTDYTGKATGVTTRARFLWTEDSLHAFFELEGAGLFVDTSRPIETERDELYKEDCVEIFLVPDAARLTRYLEIELGPYGHWLDIDIDRERERKERRFDQAWSSGARIATTRDAAARRATIEVSLSSRDITAALTAGARLPIGLYRMEGKSPGKHYLAWSPPLTQKPKFHVPEAFGVLLLEPR